MDKYIIIRSGKILQASILPNEIIFEVGMGETQVIDTSKGLKLGTNGNWLGIDQYHIPEAINYPRANGVLNQHLEKEFRR